MHLRAGDQSPSELLRAGRATFATTAARVIHCQRRFAATPFAVATTARRHDEQLLLEPSTLALAATPTDMV